MRIAAAGLALFAATAAAARADDWPQFLGPQRNGASAEKGLAEAWPATGPRVVWKRDAGSGFAGPVIAQGRAILFHRVGAEDVVEACDADTGKTIWKTTYATDFADDFGKGDGPRSTPCVADGRVVTLSADGKLHAFALADGTKLWARDLRKEYRTPPAYFGVGTSPMVHDQLVLINVGGKGAGVVAFSLADGAERWKATDDGASYSSPILVDGAAVFFTRNGAVVLDAKTGAVRFTTRWRARIDASVNATPPLDLGRGRVLFTSSYDTGALLAQLRPGGADVVWRSEEALACHYTNGVVHAGHVFACEGRQEAGAKLRCVDPQPKAGPAVRWTTERFGCASILLVQGKLLMLTERGDLVLADADPARYVERARARVLAGTPVRAVPALSGGRLFARDADGYVCLDLR